MNTNFAFYSAPPAAILSNSQTKPIYSAKVILWVGGLVFLAMATGAAFVAMGGGW